MMSRITVRFMIFALLLSLLWLSALPALAAPSITVSPVWRPNSQLTSIDSNGNGLTEFGDDIRFVSVEIYATVNVEFWALGMVCTVNKALLESYTPYLDAPNTGDDLPMFSAGGDWGNALVSHTINTVDTDGKLEFAISVANGDRVPIGSNGVAKTLHLATLRYRVREDISAAGSSPFQCTSNFLNRDGRVVLTAQYIAPQVLNIITGYTLTGNAKYQGITTNPTAAQAIQFQCDDMDDDVSMNNVLATANITNGSFSVNNLRMQGRYDCEYVPNIFNNEAVPNSIHLTGRTSFNLTTSSLALLPVVLANGNVDNAGTSVNYVNSADISMVTSNWNASAAVLTTPYMFGDATGDKRINEMDLAVVANNQLMLDGYLADHLIYSIARDASASFNNHLWLGNIQSSSPSLMSPAANRDYWPAVSPDGSTIAFIRNVGTATNDVFALFTAPILNGLVGTPRRLSPASATYDAFAPSWSADGSRLAFACSYQDAWKNISNPLAYLCLIDANGGNFRLLEYVPNVNIPIRIQQPAWAGNNLLVASPYCSPSSTVKICRVRLDSLLLLNSVNLPDASDMPVIRNTPLGLMLFYRYNLGGGSYSIRYVTVSENIAFPNVSYPSSTFPNYHGNAIDTTNADFFTVSTGADPHIFVIQSNRYMSVYYTNYSSPPIDWNSGTTNTISDMFGNPDAASGYRDAIPNTVAYLP